MKNAVYNINPLLLLWSFNGNGIHYRDPSNKNGRHYNTILGGNVQKYYNLIYTRDKTFFTYMYKIQKNVTLK